MNSEIFARQLDHEIWDHPGKTAVVKYAVRKWKDRPALREGDLVTIVRFARIDGQYGPEPRLLVRTNNNAERWIHATIIDADTIDRSN